MREAPHCKFWLPKKRRYCSSTLLIGDSQFCGNHNTGAEITWLPCPIDPSHSVLKGNLEGHIRKCPFLKQTQLLSNEPYYVKGINAGSAPDDGINCDITCEMKRKYVHGLTPEEFWDLVEIIETLHKSLCGDIPESFKAPSVCSAWISGEVDRNRPFQEKHVIQQASILGNLDESGLLRRNCLGAVVEFGAGRGYLTQMLADSYGINRVLLVERKAYKLKADRSMRQKDNLTLERLRIDIEDLDLSSVESLQQVPFLAVAKHLCGSATDLKLRCCLSTRVKEKSGCMGFAVATCCHHLSQWKHYPNKELMIKLGITMEIFHAITWFTSWAVDADHGSEVQDVSNSSISWQADGDGRGVEEIVKTMKPVERAALGFKCKQLIDIGRMLWVKENGFDARLVKYVPTTVSPENHLLIASSITIR